MASSRLHPGRLVDQPRWQRPAAVVAALPFLHVSAYPSAADSAASAHASLIARAVERAREWAGGGERLVTMGHLHVHGASESLESEMPILRGGEDAVPSSVYSSDTDYVALGHLHCAQQVGLGESATAVQTDEGPLHLG